MISSPWSASLLAALFLAFLWQAPTPAAAPAPAGSSGRTARMQQLFASAEQDPAAVVALILEGSATMAVLPTAEARALGDALQPYCERVFFSPERFAGMEKLGIANHPVVKGDNPTKIMQIYRTGTGMLPLLNEGFDARKLQVGQTLKALHAAHRLSIIVAKSQFRLSAWLDKGDGVRVLVMFVPVGTGAPESPTPVGRTTITKRVLDPAWTEPETNKVYAPKDPGNVLGGYWIALDADGLGGRNGIGLHGFTGAPTADWISKGASHGCVRMLQNDIDHLFHLAVEGTSVTIVD